MILTALAALTLGLAPQQTPDLAVLTRTTLEQCMSGPGTVVDEMLDVADAGWARRFGNEQACGLTAQGWTGDDGALVAAARAAVGAEGTDWTGAVRELRVNESGPALWTQLEQVEGWAPASLLVIEPVSGRSGHVEIYFDPAG